MREYLSMKELHKVDLCDRGRVLCLDGGRGYTHLCRTEFYENTHTHKSASEYTTGGNRIISVDYTNVSFLVLTL